MADGGGPLTSCPTSCPTSPVMPHLADAGFHEGYGATPHGGTFFGRVGWGRRVSGRWLVPDLGNTFFCRKYWESQKTQNRHTSSKNAPRALKRPPMKGWFLRTQATCKFILNPRNRFLQTFPRGQDPPLSASQNPFLPDFLQILRILFCRISPRRPAEMSVDKVISYCNSWHITRDRRTMSAQYGALSPDCAALPRVEPRPQPTKGRKMPHLRRWRMGGDP